VDWRWSSAAAQTTGRDPAGFLDLSEWEEHWGAARWREVLDYGVEDASMLDRIRAATRTGRPTGAPEFIESIEAATGRRVHPLRRGPKARNAKAGSQPQLEVM
jgi:hypothetical protein